MPVRIPERAGAALLAALLLCSAAVAETNDCAEAQRLLRRGVELADASDEERSSYRKAIELCPSLPEGHFNLGLVELRRGDNDAAAEQFEKALELERREPFLLALAAAKTGKGDYERARQLYEEALQQNPKSVKALQGLSVVFERTKRYDKATEQLKQALALEKDNALTHYNLAVLYEQQDKLSEALEEYKNATALDDKHFSAYFFLGLLYKRMQRYDAAAAALAKAAALEPGGAGVHKALGLVYEKLGDFDKAELSFRKAVDLDSTDVDSQINLAVALIRKRREGQAEELLLRAKQRFPRQPRLLGVLGWAQLELGRYDKAEQSLKESLELDAMNGAVHNNLGVLYERTGRAEDAQREFRAALQLEDAKSAQARQAAP